MARTFLALGAECVLQLFIGCKITLSALPNPIFMHCHRLAERISQIDAELAPIDVARVCILILNQNPDPAELEDDASLRRLCKAAGFRFKAAADQHAAMTAELDSLCVDGPTRFDGDQIWTLVRAIKVQSQILDLYTDQPAWT
jgi:hypothetical protein